MIGAPLVSDSRLEQIEAQVRREFPGLPDGAKFVTYEQEPTIGLLNGVEVPVPPTAVTAILVPNPKWPEREPQYRMIRAPRLLSRWRHFEKQRERLVAAPDVVLTDFRAIAKRAVALWRDSQELN